MVTIYDIAKSLGLSASAVSRALRDGEGLRPETVAQVRAEAGRLGYLPRPRKSAQPPLIAILCPEVESGFYNSIVTKLSRILTAEGYRCVTILTDFDRRTEGNLLSQLPGRGMSGLVCLTESRDLGPEVEACIRLRRTPAVQIGMNAPAGNFDNVRVDEEVGIRAILCHLRKLGHRRIAFLGGQFSAARAEFFEEIAGEMGLDGTMYRHEGVDFRCGYELADHLLEVGKLPTAVVGEYDAVALGAIRRLREAGLRIPEDVSVAGFDDAEWCPFLTPSLTTVHSHLTSMCEIASGMLLRKLRDPGYTTVQNILIKPDLIIRESTGKARAYSFFHT